MNFQQSSQQYIGGQESHVSRASRLSNHQLPHWSNNSMIQRQGSKQALSIASQQPSTHQLLQQNINQGGSADQSANDELANAVEQIRLRHQTDLKLEEARAQQQQQSSMEVKDIREASNTTEFLLLSLQRSFNMKSQQVQQLLTNQNIVLLRASEQGLPIGDYTKMTLWYSFLLQDDAFKKMIQLFGQAYSQQQEIDVLLVLGALRVGLYSTDESIAKLCVDLLQKTVDTLKQSDMRALNGFVTWFTKTLKQPEDSIIHNSVLQSAAECAEQHHTLVTDLTKLIFSVMTAAPSITTLGKLPALLRAAYQDDIFMAYETMNSILSDLKKLDRELAKQMIEDSSLLQEALIEATDNHGDLALKLKTTNLLIEIWFLFPTIVSQPAQQHAGIGSLSRKNSFHYVLQQGLQERDKVFRINLFANGFTLLDRLAQKDNSETTAVYKTLISGLVDHYKGKESENQLDQVSIELILRGFKTVFAEHDDVPRQLLLEPWLDQLILNQKQLKPGENLLRAVELDFLLSVTRANVKTLPEDTVHALLEYLHLVIPVSPFVAKQMNLADLMGELVCDHKESINIVRLVEQVIMPQTLNSLMTIKKDEIVEATKSPLSSQHAKKGRSPAKGSKGRKLLERKLQEMAAERRVKRFNIVSLVDRIYEGLDGARQQDNVVELVRSASTRYKDAFQSTSTALMHLMQKWEVIVDAFRQKQSLVPALYEDEAQSMIVALTEAGTCEDHSRRAEKRRKKELEWSKIREPSNPIALRAVEQYQAKKQKRIEQQNQQRLEEAKKVQKQQRLNSQAKLEVAKRGLLLERDSLLRQQKVKAIFGEKGSTSILDSRIAQGGLEELEPQSVLVQQLGPTKAKSLARLKKPGLEAMADQPKRGNHSVLKSQRRRGYALIDLGDTEEDREHDSVRLALQKYSPLFRFLFDSYTNKLDSIRKQPPKGKSVNEKVMTMAELVKMYREHNMDHGMLTKSEFQMLVQLVNDKLLKPYDDDALNFAGFVQFFWQSAVFCHTHNRFKAPHETGGKDIAQLLYGEMIANGVTWFKFAARSRGLQTAIYDHPELASDPQKARQLQQLNERVKANPKISLPPGYVMSKELHQERDYNIPESARKVLGPKKAMALELLDEIMTKSLGLRLIEPQIVVKETQIVKLATQHQKNRGEAITGSTGLNSILQSNRNIAGSELLSINSSAHDFRTSPLNNLSAKKNIRSQALQQKKKLRSNVQSILQNRDFEDSDIYGLGQIADSSKDFRSEQAPSRQSIQSLDIYKTENILSIVAENRRKETVEEAKLLKKHRAGSSLLPVNRYNQLKTRSSSQVRSVQALPAQLKVDRQRRLQENLLFQSEISADLKAATYEYQLSMNDGMDMENTRQTALVLEDMLRVVTGEIAAYPFQPKKVIPKNQHLMLNPRQAFTEMSTPAFSEQQKRSISLQMKNKNVMVKQRLMPGERKSKLQMMREEERQKQEEADKIEQEKKDLDRIKRSIILKKRIADGHSVSRDAIGASHVSSTRAHSVMSGAKAIGVIPAGMRARGGANGSQLDSLQQEAILNDDLQYALQSIQVNDVKELDKKKLAQMRAQQLKLSQTEREARKVKMQEDGIALATREKEEKKRAAQTAKVKIERDLAKRHVVDEETKQSLEAKRMAKAAAEAKKTAEEAKLRRNAIEKSIERLAKPVPAKPQPATPQGKPVDPQTKSAFKAQQKTHMSKLNRQKAGVYTKKERQEVLAFYLRPDVQTVMNEYEGHLGTLFDYIVRANSPAERDLKRMTVDGYVKGFAESSEVTPGALKAQELEMLFQTIVNERVDAGSALTNPALGAMGHTISFEEFKKSFVRLASIVVVTANKKRMEPNEAVDVQQRLLDNQGGEAPAEWDEDGNAIRYKTVIQLKKKDQPKTEAEPAPAATGKNSRGVSAARRPGLQQKNEPPKLYDISKLRLEKFHHVLHFCYSHFKDKVIQFQQPETSLLAMAQLQQDRGRGGSSSPAKRVGFDQRGIHVQPIGDSHSPDQKKSVDFVGSRALSVQDEERADLNINNGSIRNDGDQLGGGGLGAGSGARFKSSIGSHQRGHSDGQFSDYNEILRSPDRQPGRRQQIAEGDDDEINDNYDLERE